MMVVGARYYVHMYICTYIHIACMCVYLYMSTHAEPTALQRSSMPKFHVGRSIKYCPTLLLRLLQYVTSFCENDNK